MTYYNRDNLFNLQPIPKGQQGNQGATGAKGSDWEFFQSSNYLPQHFGSTTIFQNIQSNYSSAGGVLGFDEKIYSIPSGMTFVLVIDVKGKTLEYITIDDGITPVGSIIGGAIAPNGKIYCTPFQSSRILTIDTIGKTASIYDFPDLSTFVTQNAGYYQRACLAPNGKVYFGPAGATSVLVVDPIGNTLSQIYFDVDLNYSRGGQFKFSGLVCGPDGNLYLVPDRTRFNIPQINTTTDTINGTYGWINYNVASAGAVQNSGGVLGKDNNIYIFCRNTTTLYKFDPIGNTSTTISSPINFGQGIGSILSQNGLIYNYKDLGGITYYDIYNTNTNEFNRIYLPFVINSRCYTAHPNGNIYIVPEGTNYVVELKTGLPQIGNWMLDPYFNKH